MEVAAEAKAVGPQSPLSTYQVIRTSDLDEARTEIAKTFCDYQLDLLDVERSLDAQHSRVRLRKVTVSHVRYGAEVNVVPGELGDFYLVQQLLRGATVVSSGTESVVARPGLAAVPDPDCRLAMRWRHDSEHVSVKIDRADLEGELCDLLDGPLTEPIRFSLAMDLAGPLARSWTRQLHQLITDLDAGGGLVEHPLAVGNLEHSLLTGLLLAQRHNYTERLTARQPDAGVRSIRAAVDLIESHPEYPLAVGDLARRANLSIRALQSGFRRHLDTTPMAYLTRVRLQRAREDLAAARPDSGLTVSEIAWRWGFTHLGRFAAAYRERYGELPSQSLRRGGPSRRH